MDTLYHLLQDNSDIANAVAALFAVVVAVVSLAVSLITLLFQRQHNFKSVLPIAEFVVGDYENDIHVALEKKGVGPLIVSNFIATHHGKTKNSLIDFMPDLGEDIAWSAFTGNINGRSLTPNEKLFLLRLEQGENVEQHTFSARRDEVREVLGECLVEVFYTDVYDRRIQPKYRYLDWFRR